MIPGLWAAGTELAVIHFSKVGHPVRTKPMVLLCASTVAIIGASVIWLLFGPIYNKLMGNIIRQEDVSRVAARSECIVRALKAYKSEFGQYPQRLDAVVPKYIKSIPRPEWGTDRYKYSSKGGYFLLQVDKNQEEGAYEAIICKDGEWYSDQ